MFVCQHAVLSDLCSVLVTCEMAGLLARLCVMFSCVVVTFSYVVLCQVCHSIVSIPDLSLAAYAENFSIWACMHVLLRGNGIGFKIMHTFPINVWMVTFF